MVQKTQNKFQTNKPIPSSSMKFDENQPKKFNTVEKVESWLNNDFESTE